MWKWLCIPWPFSHLSRDSVNACEHPGLWSRPLKRGPYFFCAKRKEICYQSILLFCAKDKWILWPQNLYKWRFAYSLHYYYYFLERDKDGTKSLLSRALETPLAPIPSTKGRNRTKGKNWEFLVGEHCLKYWGPYIYNAPLSSEIPNAQPLV